MKFVLLVFGLLFAFPSYGLKQTACAKFEAAVAKGTASQKLNKFLDVQWNYLMHEYPEWATYSGYAGQNDRWTDYSLPAIEKRDFEVRCQLGAIKKISRAALKGEQQITRDLAIEELEKDIEGQKFDGKYLMMDHLSGFHMNVVDMLETMPSFSKKDYEGMLARLEKAPALAEQTEILLKEGLKRKVTPVKMFLQQVPGQFDIVLTEKIEDSPLYKPFKEMKDIEGKKELQKLATHIIETKVYPAYKKLKNYLVTEYIPNSREEIAFIRMPNGEAWYNHKVKHHTTTKLTAEEIHQIGLKEVDRLTKAMLEVKAEAKFKGDLKDFNKFLSTDSQFFYKNKEDLLSGYRNIAKKIDPELPKLFKTLPRLTYGIRSIPDYKEKGSPTAYYDSGNIETGRPGYFNANTYDLNSRPKWGMENLTIHEAVPGHHLQIALAEELKDLPNFRRFNSYTAYSEGWALYAESLGYELGLYKDVYSKYGQLTAEMWRSVRLVVDTGMHAKAWTRQQAIDYFLANTPMSPHEAKVEIDRYITWPGQALGYKIGQLKFKELRAKATAELGDKFDVREFHDECLKHGSLPMGVLEKVIDDWIMKVKKENKKAKKTA